MDSVMIEAIDMLWQGMLGVFLVIGLIAILVSVLARFTKD